jgi:hypothetical protein
MSGRDSSVTIWDSVPFAPPGGRVVREAIRGGITTL